MEAGYLVMTAVSVAAARQMLRQASIEVALVQLQLERESGLDLVREIGPPDGRPNVVAVLALSDHAAPRLAADVLSLGAADYVRTPCPVVELVARVAAAVRWIRAIRTAQSVPAPATTENDKVDVTPSALEQLTRAEVSVATYVAQGFTNRAIAAELFVSVKAVEFHLGHIFRKLTLSNRTQLAALLANSGPPHSPPTSKTERRRSLGAQTANRQSVPRQN
jgi:DNA-binding NarL/FixJ family response regulator